MKIRKIIGDSNEQLIGGNFLNDIVVLIHHYHHLNWKQILQEK